VKRKEIPEEEEGLRGDRRWNHVWGSVRRCHEDLWRVPCGHKRERWERCRRCGTWGPCGRGRRGRRWCGRRWRRLRGRGRSACRPCRRWWGNRSREDRGRARRCRRRGRCGSIGPQTWIEGLGFGTTMALSSAERKIWGNCWSAMKLRVDRNRCSLLFFPLFFRYHADHQPRNIDREKGIPKKWVVI